MAAGSVLLWGKVIEGTWGYRAQHGYPERLWLLPPARIGGADPAVISETTITLARDLLVTLRHRYHCPVGYAAQGTDAGGLLGCNELGWFFSWRLSATGADRLGRALGKTGDQSVGSPTVDAALELWLEVHRDNGSYNDRRHIREHIAHAFGHIEIDRPDLIDAIDYQPISRTTGKPYRSRTVAHHRNLVRQAMGLARERWRFA